MEIVVTEMQSKKLWRCSFFVHICIFVKFAKKKKKKTFFRSNCFCSVLRVNLIWGLFCRKQIVKHIKMKLTLSRIFHQFVNTHQFQQHLDHNQHLQKNLYTWASAQSFYLHHSPNSAIMLSTSWVLFTKRHVSLPVTSAHLFYPVFSFLLPWNNATRASSTKVPSTQAISYFPFIVAAGQHKQANKAWAHIISFPYRWKVCDEISKCPFEHKTQWFSSWCSSHVGKRLRITRTKNTRETDIHCIVILKGH